MQKRTREIIALVMLIVLGIAGLSAVGWYILVGHNWNAAATSIDDRIGNMDGYTVILCEGSVPSLAEQRALSESQPMLEEQNLGSFDDGATDEDAVPLKLEDALASYIEKGAHVVTVQSDDARYYEDPVIVQRSGKRFAIFSVSGPRPDLAAKNVLKELRAYDIDFTICLVGDIGPMDEGVEGLDLAFCYDLDEAGLEGRYHGPTYIMGAPYDGQVGAVIMAPSGFLSSKMIAID